MATAAQLTACAANAQLSTGPRSPEGKAASSNAVKLGLYSHANILPGEDPASLEQLTRDLEDQYHPQTADEFRLLHDLVRGIWLERRYTRIETEIIKVRFAAPSEDQRQSQRARTEPHRLQAERPSPPARSPTRGPPTQSHQRAPVPSGSF